MKKKSPKVRDEEYRFTDGVIISETDTKGIITYANRKFCHITGYEKSELIGKNHNIIRHPDMPKEVFRQMWSTIQSGKPWEGMIKNLRKDGRYFWVYTYIRPIIKEEGIAGYIAAIRPADPEEIAEAKMKYNALRTQEKVRRSYVNH
jgi:aerotaxis receptor